MNEYIALDGDTGKVLETVTITKLEYEELRENKLEQGNWLSADDYYRNVLALDIALNGEGGATRPLLIDVLGQVEMIKRELGMPILKYVEMQIRNNQPKDTKE